MISTDVSINKTSELDYKLVLQLADTLAPGRHDSRIEGRLCEDSPAICAKPFDGSPWYVPLAVDVKPAPS
ncbi:hypothetical protein PO883_07875 [Massilia sp. DJPM01]|uniref:hypothetical protein n=1 Tax=Massilia sp. DJPM01 TaxID=3024404 RepID=UPI00259DE63F|nr:hypothetical protein [Massilia sp. DJPM01]MDM5177112.1 hypothetical protein [Massilia sp. DJPM01]